MSKKTKRKASAEKKVVVEEKHTKTRIYKKPILAASLKFTALVLLIGSGIYYSDSKGYFNKNKANNHVERRWNSFYKFTKKNDIDVLLLGDSHLFTGINPKNLSTTLSANSFIIASPYTHVGDAYYGLKEALTKSKPSLVVLETYLIKDLDPYTLKKGPLSNQIRSFSARKNIKEKLLSTPSLFAPDNYFYAWSKTILNHSYIFTNEKQLEQNLEIIEKGIKQKEKKLFLGRYIRFKNGLQDSTLKKYETTGAPVNGADYQYSASAEVYVKKIVDLCNENGIELMFFTIPMYHKHVEDYASWKNTLNEIIGKYDKHWFDLQEEEYNHKFYPKCFENTYDKNQHQTYTGSLITTYELANYIQTKMDIKLPDRSKNNKWHNLFYGDEGYFENHPVLRNDAKHQLICKDRIVSNGMKVELLSILNKDKKSKQLIAKIDRKYLKNPNKKTKLALAVKMEVNKQVIVYPIKLYYDTLHEPSDKAVFRLNVKNIKFIDLVDAAIQ